jgi:hypothetical protein
MVEGMDAAAALTDQERSAVSRYLGDIAVVLRRTVKEPRSTGRRLNPRRAG